MQVKSNDTSAVAKLLANHTELAGTKFSNVTFPTDKGMSPIKVAEILDLKIFHANNQLIYHIAILLLDIQPFKLQKHQHYR